MAFASRGSNRLGEKRSRPARNRVSMEPNRRRTSGILREYWSWATVMYSYATTPVRLIQCNLDLGTSACLASQVRHPATRGCVYKLTVTTCMYVCMYVGLYARQDRQTRATGSRSGARSCRTRGSSAGGARIGTEVMKLE